MTLYQTITLALLGGILPAIVWLIYWLREDRQRPEPVPLIVLAFIAGMIGVPIAFVLQWLIDYFILDGANIEFLFKTSYITAMVVLVLWSTIEEVIKYLAAYFSDLKRKENDEPLDAIIYLVTAALGFAALENALFILAPILAGNIGDALIIGNMRFIGSTLVHVASSATIGIFVAFSFYKNNEIKSHYLLTGFVFSITLHTIFNSFIIRAEVFTLIGMILVWTVVIGILLIIEKVKKIKNITPQG